MYSERSAQEVRYDGMANYVQLKLLGLVQVQ